ncbi:UMP kinase [Candidatus Pacearchaeota archaeon]|nr:UMP kinase [Candidatus Pacearchaeota archaeon]
MKEIIVISLGGSLIVPKHIDTLWINKFKEKITKLTKKYKFVIVCGGGFVAREYITILKKEHKSKKQQSMAGIAITRMNAQIMAQIFGKIANEKLPFKMKQIKNMLQKNEVVFCGALRYSSNQTSDTTAAKVAKFLKTKFINITNVDGLYTSNPSKNKNAKLIKSISWKDFEKIAKAIKYKPGQHFVLDQKASTIIRKNKIKTYILGKNLTNLQNLLNQKIDAPPRLKSHCLKRCSIFGCSKCRPHSKECGFRETLRHNKKFKGTTISN